MVAGTWRFLSPTVGDTATVPRVLVLAIILNAVPTLSDVWKGGVVGREKGIESGEIVGFLCQVEPLR